MHELARRATNLAAKFENFSAIARRKWRGFVEVRRIFYNWPQVTLFRLGLSSRILANWRAGNTTLLESQDAWEHLRQEKPWRVELLKSYGCRVSIEHDEVQLVSHSRLLRFRLDPHFDTHTVLLEQFVFEDYIWPNFVGKRVLDIGASIGDSAIYFILRGAAHVYALEPNPAAFRLAQTNIRLNDLEDKVTLLNAGCGTEGSITIDSDLRSDPSYEMISSEKGNKVAILSLRHLVEAYGITDAVAKIDCEGCEYDLVLQARDEELRAFDQFIIEYHRGCWTLVDRLKRAGSRAMHKPRYIMKEPITGKILDVGLIQAKRI